MRVDAAIVRGLAATAGAARAAGQAVVNDRGFQHMARLGQYEMGAALQALPTSNVYMGHIGLHSAPALER